MDKITDELRVLVEAEVERAIRDLEKFDDALGKSEKSAGNLGKALEAMEKQALVLSAAVAGLGTIGIKVAADNEKLRASLEVMLGSAEKATTIFEEWKKFGATTPLSLGEISGAGKALLAFGVNASDITTTMRRLGDVAQGVGSSLEQVAQVYGKVKVQGKASALEIMQMQRQGIPVVQALAKALGTTEENIKAMVSAGKIGFPEMEKAFQAMTENGGQFEGMMDKLSQTTSGKFSTAMDNAKQAAASFGELLLPMVNDMLDAANDLLKGIMNMDEGTKRFILGFGGVVAISGPTIAAINGVKAAMTAAMANPWMLAIGGVIAAAGTVVGIINKQAHAYEDLNKQIHKTQKEADSLLESFSEGNSAKKLDAETTQKLIKLYPQLAGEITAYSSTVDDAAAAVRRLNREEVLAAAQKQLIKLQEQAKAVDDALKIYDRLRNSNAHYAEDQAGIAGQAWNAAADQYHRMRKEIETMLGQANMGLGVNDTIIDLPERARPAAPSLNPPPSGTGEFTNAKKRWQEWYSEITKVDLASITMKEQGEELGKLFIDGLTGTMTVNQNIAEVLGKEFDLAGALRAQSDDIERALKELLSISPSNIDDPFEFNDKFIAPLASRFKELDREIKDADYLKTIEDLQKKIDDFGKSERQLAEETALANGYLPEQAAEIARLTEEYANLTAGVREHEDQIRSLEDVIRDGLIKAFPDLEKQAASSIAAISANLADIAFDGILDGLSAIGAAFAKGENAADSFVDAMAQMAQSMLDMLPSMFLQAGLQLIIQGNWPLGLGFIAAAGSSALISGLVRGYREKETANAHGNAYDTDGMLRFARGGAFTNQCINAPTYFRHGGGLGLMGEAGPEAVVPLKRMSNGDLGISSGGTGAQVIVNIINNSGEKVTQEERTNENGGREVDIIIGAMIDKHLASGKADRVLGARYNVHPQGV